MSYPSESMSKPDVRALVQGLSTDDQHGLAKALTATLEALEPASGAIDAGLRTRFAETADAIGG